MGDIVGALLPCKHPAAQAQPLSWSVEHICWIEEKYMVIHIYGITLNAAKSVDQYYFSYSYQSSSLISYLMYNDLHHDCKPYEQTREFFTVSLYSP